TVRLAVDVMLPSETVSVTVLLPSVALHPAAIVAVIAPLLLLIEPMEMPVGTVVAVTIRLPGAVSTSLTAAICTAVPATLPCWRVKVPPAVIVGGVVPVQKEMPPAVPA